MKKSRRGRAAAAAMFSIAVAFGVAGCVEGPIAFDPRDAFAHEVKTDSEIKSRELGSLPTTTPSTDLDTPEQPVMQEKGTTLNVDEGRAIPMTLREIVHRTVTNNLDIRVAAYDTAIDQTRIMEEQAAFDPTFFMSYSYQRVDKMTGGTEVSIPNTANPNTNNASSAFPSSSTVITRIDQEGLQQYEIGFRQNTSSGAQLQISQGVANNYFKPARTLLNPYYENDLVVSLTQPLLQNFGTEVNTARIRIAQNNQRVSLLDFRKTVEETVLKVEQDYWQLEQAQQDVATIQRLIGESMATTDILKRRKNMDTTAPQILQAQAETANRRVQLATARSRMFGLSDDIKRIMHDPRYPVSGAGTIQAADPFSDVALRFNLDDQIETGMKNRLELGQQQVRIASAQIAHYVAENGLLPSLDLTAQYELDAVAHSLATTFSDEGNFNHNGFTLGLNLSVPIGNRAARAVFKRAELQEIQAMLSYFVLVEQVSEDVKQASRGIDTAWYQLMAARESRLEYQGLLDKLETQIREGAEGVYSFEQVYIRLQDQQQLAAAEQQEHQALNDYNYAIANLEHAKGTILRYNNVILEQDSRPLDQLNKYGGSHGTPFQLSNKDQ